MSSILSKAESLLKQKGPTSRPWLKSSSQQSRKKRFSEKNLSDSDLSISLGDDSSLSAESSLALDASPRVGRSTAYIKQKVGAQKKGPDFLKKRSATDIPSDYVLPATRRSLGNTDLHDKVSGYFQRNVEKKQQILQYKNSKLDDLDIEDSEIVQEAQPRTQRSTRMSSSTNSPKKWSLSPPNKQAAPSFHFAADDKLKAESTDEYGESIVLEESTGVGGHSGSHMFSSATSIVIDSESEGEDGHNSGSGLRSPVPPAEHSGAERSPKTRANTHHASQIHGHSQQFDEVQEPEKPRLLFAADLMKEDTAPVEESVPALRFASDLFDENESAGQERAMIDEGDSNGGVDESIRDEATTVLDESIVADSESMPPSKAVSDRETQESTHSDSSVESSHSVVPVKQSATVSIPSTEETSSSSSSESSDSEASSDDEETHKSSAQRQNASTAPTLKRSDPKVVHDAHDAAEVREDLQLTTREKVLTSMKVLRHMKSAKRIEDKRNEAVEPENEPSSSRSKDIESDHSEYEEESFEDVSSIAPTPRSPVESKRASPRKTKTRFLTSTATQVDLGNEIGTQADPLEFHDAMLRLNGAGLLHTQRWGGLSSRFLGGYAAPPPFEPMEAWGAQSDSFDEKQTEKGEEREQIGKNEGVSSERPPREESSRQQSETTANQRSESQRWAEPRVSPSYQGYSLSPDPFSSVSAPIVTALHAANDILSLQLQTIQRSLQTARLQASMDALEFERRRQTRKKYTTLEDTKRYIKRNRPRVRTFEEALREVKRQDGLL